MKESSIATTQGALPTGSVSLEQRHRPNESPRFESVRQPLEPVSAVGNGGLVEWWTAYHGEPPGQK